MHPPSSPERHFPHDDIGTLNKLLSDVLTIDIRHTEAPQSSGVASGIRDRSGTGKWLHIFTRSYY